MEIPPGSRSPGSIPGFYRLRFPGDPRFGLSVRLRIDLTARESHPAPDGGDPRRPATEAGVAYEVPLGSQGSEVVNRLVDPLLPGVMLLPRTAALEEVPD